MSLPMRTCRPPRHCHNRDHHDRLIRVAQFGIRSIGNALVLMLIELILTHACVFPGVLDLVSGNSRERKIRRFPVSPT